MDDSDGFETHVMDDGTHHDAHECPEGCVVRAGLRRLLGLLDAGTHKFVQVL